MKAIVVTDQAAGTAGAKLVDRPEPGQLIPGESRGMNLNNDVVYRRPRRKSR